MISRIFTVFIVVFAFISCSSDEDSMQRELNENRQLWESSQIENYKWSERYSCYCGGVLFKDIFVVNNIKVSVDFDESMILSENLEEIRTLTFNNSKTIDDAFSFIEELLNSDVASLVVEYDATYGFPTLISIDYIKDAIDDEIAYIYSNFEIQTN